MKRSFCVILACILLAAAAVPAVASGPIKSDVELVLATINEAVAETEDIAASVQEIIRWQLDGSEEELAAYKEATLAGEDYESSSDYDDVVAKAEELDLYIKRVSTLRAQVEALAPTTLTSVDKTIDAAKMYFSLFESALNDLMSIFDFYFAEYDAGKPVNDYDEASYGDDVAASLEGLYYAIQDSADLMDQIVCPPFMQECFAIYTKTTRKYLAVLDTMYTAVQIEDVLRSASSSYLIGRMTIEIANCEIELTRLFNLQYEKVEERLNGRIATLRGELVSNCALLAAAL